MIVWLVDQSRHRAASVQTRHQRRAFEEAAMATRCVMRFAWYGRASARVNQLFGWRRAYRQGELSEPSGGLIPVRVSGTDPSVPVERIAPPSSGSIHIEFPGRALISIESGADPTLLRSILESLRK